MRKEYGVALRDLFTELLGSVCPLFEWVKKPSILAGVPGERAYRWIVAENDHAWVVLVPDQKREAFTIELGWSRKSRFPQLSMRPSLAHPKDVGSEDEYLCRLGELVRGTDWWWIIDKLPLFTTQDQIMDYIGTQTKPISPEVARLRVMPHVHEAIEEFQRFGLPFLRAHLPFGEVEPRDCR
jgi:hypothetical protein